MQFATLQDSSVLFLRTWAGVDRKSQPNLSEIVYFLRVPFRTNDTINWKTQCQRQKDKNFHLSICKSGVEIETILRVTEQSSFKIFRVRGNEGKSGQFFCLLSDSLDLPDRRSLCKH